MTRRDLDLSGYKIESYLLEKKVGSGAFADVYRAKDLGGGSRARIVAAKVFWHEAGDKHGRQKIVRDFRAELDPISILGTIETIVTYHTNCTADIDVEGLEHSSGSTLGPDSAVDDSKSTLAFSVFVIITEFAEGDSLSLHGQYRDNCMLHDRDKRGYLDHFIGVCDGLINAHKQRFVHCDIKPENLLFFPEANRVKIGDFGIAKHQRAFSATALDVVGTPPYMAPECFRRGEEPRAGRDIYALGCTLYELFTGQMAFPFPQTRSLSSLGVQRDVIALYSELHSHDERPDAYVRADGLVSVELSEFLKRMMSIRAKDRPSLEDVKKALEKEKPYQDPGRRIILESQKIKLPKGIMELSGYDVSPHYRLDVLGERIYFIFLKMDRRSIAKVQKLHWLLRNLFFDTFSVFETFGQDDFIVRIPCRSPDDIETFCEHAIDAVLNGRREALRVLVSSEYSLLGAKNRKAKVGVKRGEIIVKLHAAQRREDQAAVEWLRKNGIYVRKRLQRKGEQNDRRVRCFTRIHWQNGHDAKAQYALVQKNIVDSGLNAVRLEVAVYVNDKVRVGQLFTDEATFLVSFVAPAYEDVIGIPAVLLGETFVTATLLATGRYGIQSDRVSMRG